MDQIQQAVSTGYVTLELATVMVVLATISVIIRFVSKTFTRGRFSYDDYWIVFSLVAFWSYFGLLCGAVFGGGGGLGMPNLRKLDAAGVSFYVKLLLISASVFVLGTATVQISILLYYRRIFTTQKFKRKTLGLGVIVALAWLVSELGIILQCFPLDSYWNPLVAGHCQNLNIFVMAMGLIDLLLDISILILPMSMIPELRLPLKHKISLSVIFLLGGLVCISATVRLALVYRPGQGNINVVKRVLLSDVHLGTAIICACLPTYRPILSKCAKSIVSMQLKYKSWFNSKPELNSFKSNPYTMDGSKSQKPCSDQVSSDQDDLEYMLGVVTAITRGEGSVTSGTSPNRITVESTMSIE